MSVPVLYMSMSVDRYIAGPNAEPSNPGWGTHFIDEGNATGAVLAGRRTVEQVDHWGGNHHGVPIFVVSHQPPSPSMAKYPLVTYMTDGIASAMAPAKAAAKVRTS